MDSKILKITLFALLALSLSACEKDANIPVPEEDPKLVVYSYICPEDTAINVSVTTSNPVFGGSGSNNYAKLENAVVTVSTNGITYPLAFNPMTSYYYISTSTVSISPGQQFDLNVSAPGYESVSASTTIPNASNFDFNASFISKTELPETQSAIYKFDVSWNHFTASDYYRVVPVFYYTDTAMGFDDTLIANFGNDFFYTEKQAASGKITDNLVIETYYEGNVYPESGFFITLIVCEYDYFKFHESLSNYTYGDPFAEPTLIYTKMKNGYGIFGGYLRRVKRIDQ